MQKISGIIPGSSRVTAVDMKDSAPVRPGTPSFGRPEGVSTLAQKNKVTTASKSSSTHEQMMDWRTKEGQNAGIARTITDRFFQTKKEEASPFDVEESADSVVTAAPGAIVQKAPVGQVQAVAGTDGAEGETVEAFEAPEPDALYPKGSFIDYQA